MQHRITTAPGARKRQRRRMLTVAAAGLLLALAGCANATYTVTRGGQTQTYTGDEAVLRNLVDNGPKLLPPTPLSVGLMLLEGLAGSARHAHDLEPATIERLEAAIARADRRGWKDGRVRWHGRRQPVSGEIVWHQHSEAGRDCRRFQTDARFRRRTIELKRHAFRSSGFRSGGAMTATLPPSDVTFIGLACREDDGSWRLRELARSGPIRRR